VARRASRWDWLLLGTIAGTLVGYWAYWFPGLFLGSRFLFIAVPALVIFSAKFMAEFWARRMSHVGRSALLALPVSLVLAWLPMGIANGPTGVWHRMVEYRKLVEPRNPDLDEDIDASGITHALVFVREPFHRRLAARLRVLGMRPYAVEQIIPNVDACALLHALNAVDSTPSLPDSVRLARVISQAQSAGRADPVPGLFGSRSLALIDGRASSPTCAQEIAGDDTGTAAFEIFLAQAEFDQDGRLDGNVVYARDLGARNELLRRRFGDRTWYRVASEKTPSGMKAVFIPY
jgi:hypothetical protein